MTGIHIAHASYLAEIHRLRRLIIDTADDLQVVEEVLVSLCQYASDDNADERMALFELRTVIANLIASGRPNKELA